MSDKEALTHHVNALELHSVWSDQLRATDEISLKLLAAVPTITAVGISLLLPKDPGAQLARPQAIFLGIFGAWVSFLIYRWEKRNIQICSWYRERINLVEKIELGASSEEVRRLLELPLPPALFKQHIRIGKARAEFLIYSSVVAAWLALAAYGVAALVLN
jgi:hypothetical protein